MSIRAAGSAVCLLLWLGFGYSPAVANELDVLTPSPDAPPAGRLYNWLKAQAKVHFDGRRQAVSALQTPEAVASYQRELRKAFLQGVGSLPPSDTPLNPQVTGTINHPDYRVEKVVYESRPQHHVTACLYLPQGTGPFPGVLVPCGHSANGKAAEAYQRACILMAKNGLAVLCYDPIGQGERIQLLDPQGKPVVAGSTSEHTMIGVGAFLVGTSAAAYHIHDGVRSLDYLASRPEIDPQRLGCTGNSGGGTLTSYLMAFDSRIYAAAPSCYITSLERLFATIGPQDAEQNLIGQVALGLEHAGYIALRAPRPTLICVGTQDFFDIDGAWTTFREAKSIYGVLGHGERVDLFEFNDQHGFSLPRRQAAMRWMRRWLLQQDDAPVETPFPVQTDRELQVTRTGQVLEDFKGVSAYDLNRIQAEELARNRFTQSWTKASLQPIVRKQIGLPDSIPLAQVQPHGTIVRNGYSIHKEIYETEAGIELPALRWVPEKPDPLPRILYLDGRGKGAAANPGGELEKLVAQGRTILAIDLRGWGELSPGTKGWSVAFGPDVREFFLGLHINRPLLGQRVLDVLSVAGKLAPDPASPGIEIIAHGAAGPIAQHAAFFETQIKAVTLRDSITNWTDVVSTPLSDQQLSNVIPGALTVYDLPDLDRLRESR